MKMRRDAFFLWLLAIFAGGARAPAVVSSMSMRPTHGVASTGTSSRTRVHSATSSSSAPATPGGATPVDQPVTSGAAATSPNLAPPPPVTSSLSPAPGAAAVVERPDRGDRGAAGSVPADGGFITRVVRLHAARHLLVGNELWRKWTYTRSLLTFTPPLFLQLLSPYSSRAWQTAVATYFTRLERNPQCASRRETLPWCPCLFPPLASPTRSRGPSMPLGKLL